MKGIHMYKNLIKRSIKEGKATEKPHHIYPSESNYIPQHGQEAVDHYDQMTLMKYIERFNVPKQVIKK
jgi:hypothetical protein